MSKKYNKSVKRVKLHVRKDDVVKVLAGKDKGAEGKILEVFPAKQRVLVEGINMVTKHQKPTQQDEGGLIKKEAPIHVSNLMLVDPKTGDACRIGRKEVNGKLVRYSKKSGEIIS